jgi:hypothetical protein
VSPDLPVKSRIAARPVEANGDAAPIEESIVGDPKLDPVLAAAIRAAKSREQAAR